MTTTHSRATKGGQFAPNGEWYKGGAFINTVPENPKGEAKKKTVTRRQNVEPYKWEVAPIEGQIALYPQLAGFEMPVWENRKIVGFKFNGNLRGEWATPEFIKIREARIAAYNSGERWV